MALVKVLEVPACKAPDQSGVECVRCHDTGMVHCFQALHGIGWYWVFCSCSVGCEQEDEREDIRCRQYALR